MTWFNKPLLGGVVLACALLLVVSPAPAQDLTPQAPAARRPKLDGVCSDAIAHFCPALVDRPGQTLSQVTCLKAYRTSLSLACRRAVNAALK